MNDSIKVKTRDRWTTLSVFRKNIAKTAGFLTGVFGICMGILGPIPSAGRAFAHGSRGRLAPFFEPFCGESAVYAAGIFTLWSFVMKKLIVTLAVFFTFGGAAFAQEAASVSREGEFIDSAFLLNGGAYDRITIKDCVVSNDFLIGYNERINEINISGTEFRGSVFILDNASINKISLTDCTFNGAFIVINNSRIVRDMEILNCTFASTQNKIFTNHVYGFFRFAGNTIVSHIDFTLNMLEQPVSIKGNSFNGTLQFILNTLNSFAVFTENNYRDALFNASYFNGLTIFDREINTGNIGFADCGFKSAVKFRHMDKAGTNEFSSLNLENNMFSGESAIENISNGIKIYNLYSNEYDSLNMDIARLKAEINNITITALSGSEVTGIRIVENIREELNAAELQKYDQFWLRMIENYKRLNMRESARELESASVFNRYNGIKPLPRFLSYAAYFITFANFTRISFFLIFGSSLIVIFGLLYFHGFGLQKGTIRKRPRLFFLIFARCMFLSVNFFLNLPFAKKQVRNGKAAFIEGLAGMYFIVMSMPLILTKIIG